MAIREQYVNKWRRKNPELRKQISIESIELCEYEHGIITPQMEKDFEYIQKQFVNFSKKKDTENKWKLIKNLQYKIVVRPIDGGRYALISGRFSLEVLKRLNIQNAYVYVTEAGSKEEFYEMLRKTLTISTMMPLKAIEDPQIAVSEEEITGAMAYLMKNKDFEKELVIDSATYKIMENHINYYVAKRIGLVEIRATLKYNH